MYSLPIESIIYVYYERGMCSLPRNCLKYPVICVAWLESIINVLYEKMLNLVRKY
jgi:hypothetical protein